MRLHHYALRVRDRNRAAGFYESAMGYKVYEEFDLDFDNGEKAKCLALRPPEFRWPGLPLVSRELVHIPESHQVRDGVRMTYADWHMAPEVFISDGTTGSVVGRWVEENGPGIHHMAYSVDDVAATMKQWTKMGWATFTTSEPIVSPGLIQVFTEVHPFTGLTYEFIKSDGPGFNKSNVKKLMLSTDK